MPRTEVPVIPVFTRWFGSWQLRLARRTLEPRELASAYDRAAPRWTRLVECLGYPAAYRQVFERFFARHRIEVRSRPLRVLDCGVGTGAFAIALARVWRPLLALTAVDISPAMLAAAAARFRRSGVGARLVQASVAALPFADASFDLVIAAHVLEHLPDPVAALEEMRRVLIPGGWVVICMTRDTLLGAYIQAKWRTHRITRERASEWLNAAGLEAAGLDEPRPGLFRHTSLIAIGHNPGSRLTPRALQSTGIRS